MTREEFIGRAADALMKHYGVTNETEADYLVPCVDAATAALDAVGAWELYQVAIGSEYALRHHDDDPKSEGAFVECGNEYPITRDALVGAIARAEGRCWHIRGSAPAAGCDCKAAE